MSDFILPIGIDAENVINPLNETISTMERVENTAKETGKSLNDAFAQGGRAAENIELFCIPKILKNESNSQQKTA